MIFVTVGSQKFPFDRLLKSIDDCLEGGTIQDTVFAQIGTSIYLPQHYEYRKFLDRADFISHIDACDVLITHGGTAAIISALRKGKRIIAMPRLACYGEHVDDHQLQLLSEYERAGLILTCKDANTLASAYVRCLETETVCYQSNTKRIIHDIDMYLGGKAGSI